MAENTIKARLQLKNDIEANWNKALNFIPKKGEVIIYNADDNHTSPRLKIGDGATLVNDLPFIQDNNTTYSLTQDKRGFALKDSNGLSSKIIIPGPEFIISTNTNGTNTLTGNTMDEELYDGKQILYFIKYKLNENSLSLTLKFPNNSISSAIPIYNYGTVPCTIAYPANSIIHIVYYNNAFYLASNNISITM